MEDLVDFFQAKTTFFILKRNGNFFYFEEYDLREVFKSKYAILCELFDQRNQFVQEQRVIIHNENVRGKAHGVMADIVEEETLKERVLKYTFSQVPFMTFDEIKKISYCPRLWRTYQYVPWDDYRACDLHIDAILMELAYRRCQVNKDVLVYSHRKTSWTHPVLKLREDFSVHFKTLFGFGHSSYFSLILIYKGITIHSYSTWVQHEFIDKQEVIDCTRSYHYNNENKELFYDVKHRSTTTRAKQYTLKLMRERYPADAWREAMKFCCEASNLLFTDEKAFVRKYIIEECRIFFTGMRLIYLTTDIKYIEFIAGYSEAEKACAQYRLIEIKGERISGALHFIPHFQELKDYLRVPLLIAKIEEYNKAILPILEDALVQIPKDIEKLKKEAEIVINKYRQLESKKYQYDEAQKMIKKEVSGKYGSYYNREFVLDKVKSIMQVKYPDSEEIFETCAKLEADNTFLHRQVEVLNSIRDNISQYKQTIDKYFGFVSLF